MTAVLPVPVTEETSDDTPIHWCCITQDGIPFFGLCGDLPVTQRRDGSKRISCPPCLKLITEHIAVCGPCRPFAGRYA